MARRSKNYQAAAKLIEKDKAYPITEAIDLVKKLLRLMLIDCIQLNVDRHADQQLRGAMVLPNETGKTSKSSGYHRAKNRKQALVLISRVVKNYEDIKRAGLTLM